MELNRIYNEPNLETMARMPDNSVDAIVTDPPYGLGKEPDPVKMLTAWLDHGYLEVSGSGFMGQKWDAFVPQPRFWKEAYRVLKPGGHVLSFFGTRTYDWGVMAMRLAGFEVRDQLAWVFGSGFPKSHDISKAIDKAAGAERGVLKTLKSGISSRAYQSEAKTTAGDYTITAPATPEAEAWHGWGSALKPAFEPIIWATKPLDHQNIATPSAWQNTIPNLNPIVLARKPLGEKTIAGNVLAWGTGGINVDGCRVEGEPRTTHKDGNKRTSTNNPYHGSNALALSEYNKQPSGRWPANLAHDGSPEVLAGFPETGATGTVMPHHNDMRGNGHQGNAYGVYKANHTRRGHDDNGGSAARFFYCAKADSTERNYGLSSFNCIQIKTGLCKEENTELAQLLKRVTSEVTVKWFTDESGESITAIFPTASRSIIKTEIKKTIELKTSNWLTLLHTKGFIVDAKKLKESGTSPVVSAELLNLSKQSTINEKTGFPLGAVLAVLKMPLKIKESAVKPLKNRHSTVKPLALMRWLARLITPPGGLVYDPYSGSGTTFAACMEEGFQFIGSEIDEVHADIGNKRGLSRRSLFSQE